MSHLVLNARVPNLFLWKAGDDIFRDTVELTLGEEDKTIFFVTILK